MTTTLVIWLALGVIVALTYHVRLWGPLDETQGREELDDLARESLEHHLHGHWVGIQDVGPDGVLAHVRSHWRVWRCLRLGWLEYCPSGPEDDRPFLDRRGWIRITGRGRVAYHEARLRREPCQSK